MHSSRMLRNLWEVVPGDVCSWKPESSPCKNSLTAVKPAACAVLNRLVTWLPLPSCCRTAALLGSPAAMAAASLFRLTQEFQPRGRKEEQVASTKEPLATLMKPAGPGSAWLMVRRHPRAAVRTRHAAQAIFDFLQGSSRLCSQRLRKVAEC